MAVASAIADICLEEAAFRPLQQIGHANRQIVKNVTGYRVSERILAGRFLAIKKVDLYIFHDRIYNPVFTDSAAAVEP